MWIWWATRSEKTQNTTCVWTGELQLLSKNSIEEIELFIFKDVLPSYNDEDVIPTSEAMQ